MRYFRLKDLTYTSVISNSIFNNICLLISRSNNIWFYIFDRDVVKTVFVCDFQKERKYKHKSDKNKKCLSVVCFGILSVICRESVARLQLTPAYVKLEIFTKECRVLFDYRGQIFDFRDSLFGQVEKTVLCLKKHKNKRHFCLIEHFFTRLSQNMCLIINTHILIYWHTRFDCRLWKVL